MIEFKKSIKKKIDFKKLIFDSFDIIIDNIFNKNKFFKTILVLN